MPYKNERDHIACSVRWRKANDLKLRAFIRDYKAKNPCIDCGERDPIVLEFDHRDPSQKLFSIASLRMGTIDRLKTEISKCDIRCANCHRRSTAKNGHYRKMAV
jgi:hypothetical protein